MLRLARRHRVLLVNSIGMRLPTPGKSTQPARRVARKVASITKGLRHPIPELPNFAVASPITVPLYGNAAIRSLNARSIRWQVELACRHVGIVDPVLFVTIPTAWDVVRPMRRTMLVYNRADRHSAFLEANQPVIAGYEQHLLQASQRVLYVSHHLMAEEAASTGGRAYFLDHGVDLEHFRHRAASEEPPDLAAIPHPRIGFFGGIDDQTVDVALLERVAGEIPGAQLVLVGNATVPMERLASLPNVHWLGFKPYEEIPRYGSGFDVAIMPWQRNEWIEACNPIKLKEYLALGLAVVSTDFPELQRYRDEVTIAGPEDFVAAVRTVLADGGKGTAESRRARVESDDWDAKANELAALVGLYESAGTG
jgi:glycosyltransferase involved in cell wall biosynthesis